MATQTKKDPVTENLESAAERVTELHENVVDSGRKAGLAYLDSYEKAVVEFADSFEKAAGATKIDWLTTVASTQAKATREVTKAYTATARDLVS
jgi:hypothetical protein